MSAVIEVEGLRAGYRRRRPVLDGLHLSVPAGQVHGLLGGNGAGKTTALRVMLGLVRAEAGQVRLLRRTVPRELAGIAHRVAAVVGPPRFPTRPTVRQTLRLAARLRGLPVTAADRALEQHGLLPRADDPVGTLSTGDLRRLALAAALLGSPDVVLLDDPTDGLDPEAAAEVHATLTRLAAGGAAVLLATRRVAEVEAVCDAVTVVADGRTVATHRVPDLLAAHDQGEFRVRVSDLDRAVAIIGGTGLPVTVHDDHFVVGDLADPTWLSQTLGRNGLWVHELTPLRPSLASIYRSLVDGASSTSVPAAGAPAAGAPAPSEAVRTSVRI